MNWGAWTWAAWASVILLACSDSSQVDGDGGEELGAIHQSAMKGTPGAAVGDTDYCGADSSHLCGLGEGPCTSTGQCSGTLTCIPGNLAKRGVFSGGACAPSTCSNGSLDPGETSIDCGGSCGSDCTVTCDTANGSASHCSRDCPCTVGEGQCDADTECQQGLVCGVNNGGLFHLSSTLDVCWAATCQNSVKDGNETAIDCGGSCAPCTPPAAGPVTLVSPSGAPLSIVVAPHSDQNLQTKITAIANDLRNKLNTIAGSTGVTFTVAQPTNTPSDISLGIDGDFPNTGWPYQGYFRPNDTLAGGVLRPERLQLTEQYVLHTPQNSNRVIVAGATLDALQDAVSDLLARIGYRHYFPSPTWEVFPESSTLQQPLTLAVDERPAFLSRTLNFPGDTWESAFTNVSKSYFEAWAKHNRFYTSTALAPGGSFAAVVIWWQNKYGVTFPPQLSTNPAVSYNNRQFCLTGVGNAANQQWTVEKVVKEWASEQNAAARLSISPNGNVTWASAPLSGGSGLNCNDVNDPIYRNISNRIAAILNAAAEIHPTKVVIADALYDTADAPTLALRQNVIVNVHANYVAPIPFAFENRLRNWGASSSEVGVTDLIAGTANEFPGQAQLSTASVIDRVRTFYGLGARRYELNVYTGFGTSGPAWWALSKALWDLDTPTEVNASSYRTDFLTKAFGSAADAMNKYYQVIEDRALWSDNMVGVMYRALNEAFLIPSVYADTRIRTRLEDLAVYTRYLELSRKFWNRCDAQSPNSEQSQLRELLRFTYAARDRRIFESYDAISEILQAVPNCTSTVEPTSGPACDMAVWSPTCPSATTNATCGSCSGSNPPAGCNPMKTVTAPNSSEIFNFVRDGASNVPVLDVTQDPTLIKEFTRDLVPYPLTPTLPKRLQSIYTRQPHYLFFQRPSSAGPLTAHVIKFAANEILAGRLSLPSSPNSGLAYRFLSDYAPETETDWIFDNTWANTAYRLDLDDSGGRMYTTFPEGTRVAIPVGPKDAPLALNYRWQGYFLVPAGTTKVVGWSQSDGTFFRNKKNAQGTAWITEPAAYLSDFAVGHACTNPHDIANGGLSGLWDHFVIPIPSGAPTDELWLFNDGAIGTVGERVLLNVPPYLYQSPEGMLVPREVSPEVTSPVSCNSKADCSPGQFCSQGATCLTETGGCTTSAQCHPGESCNGGTCGCQGTVSATGECLPITPCVGDAPCPTSNPSCDETHACPSPLVCPSAENGWRFGKPGERVCERPDCCSNPSEIGTTTPECGLCVCTPHCEGKVCGDADLSDGCGGKCEGLCDSGANCTKNADCSAGNICTSGKCVSATTCSVTPPFCGPNSGCPCPVPTTPSCDDRECGSDPISHNFCGTCGASRFCNAAGRCVSQDGTPPVEVPRADGGLRTVLPPAAPPTPSVGATPGSFAVTDRGSASYSIPIEVPPGRAGMEPALSIRYTSSTGNGALGAGWSIDGFSSIARCPRSYAQDGRAKPIQGDVTDAYCLDGQRLVEVAPGDYRTEVETFSKVLAVGSTPTGPEYFKVYTRDGRIQTYGKTQNARNMLRGSIVGSWALNREEDRFQNYIRITYDQVTANLGSGETSTAEMVPSAVTYTGHGSVDGDREVRFEYNEDAPRLDRLSGFRSGGGAFERTRLLRSIEVRASNVGVRRYAFTYAPSSEATRLLQIQECSGPIFASCRQPTQFTYFDEEGFNEGENRIIPPESGKSVAPPFTANGIARKSDKGHDWLTVMMNNATPYLVTPIPLGASTAVSIVPVAGSYVAQAMNVINAVGAQTHQRNLYETFTWDMTKDESIGAHFACGDGRKAPLRQLRNDFLHSGAELIKDTCPRLRLVYGDDVVVNGSDEILYQPRQWLIDLDGNGIQDMLYCAEEGGAFDKFGTMHLDYKLARPDLDGVTDPPLIDNADPILKHEPPHSARDGEIPTFGKLCDPLARQGFSVSIDIDNDGAANLLAYDIDSGHWAALVPNGATYAWRDMPELTFDGAYMFYVTTMDVNGDGLRDLLAMPVKDAFGIFGNPIKNPIAAVNTGRGFELQHLAAVKDGDETVVAGGTSPRYGAYVLDIDHDGVEELVFPDPDAGGLPAPWRVGRVRNGQFLNDALPSLVAGPGTLGDFDDDGNIDAFTQHFVHVIGSTVTGPFRLHKGKGRRHNLLHTVVDGLGRTVEVAYDRAVQGRDTYNGIDASGSCGAWPRRCVSRPAQPLVSQHLESHFDDQARTSPRLDRTYTYNYEGAHIDVAGYGWLGFNERTISIQDSAEDSLGTTTIEYETPEVFTPGTSTVPYSYRRAGLPKRQWDRTPVVTASNSQIQTVRRFTYRDRTSNDGRPFTYLGETFTQTTVISGGFAVATPLSDQVGETTLDAFGNPTFEQTTGHDYQFNGSSWVPDESSATVATTETEYYAADTDQWLVSRPHTVRITSTPRCTSSGDCNARTRSRVTELSYFPNTNFTRTVTRVSTDESLELTTTTDRDEAGNATRVTATDSHGDTRVSTTSYDARKLFPFSVSELGDGAEQKTQVRFDDRFGRLVVRADPNGIDETWSYDAFGVARTYSGPSGARQTDYAASDYFETGQGFPVPAALQVTAQKLGGDKSITEVSALGKVVRRTAYGFNGEQVFEEFGYNDRQLLTIQTRPHLANDTSQGNLFFEYDELDRPTHLTFADGTQMQKQYCVALACGEGIPIIPGAVSYVRTVDQRAFGTTAGFDRDGATIGVVNALGDLTRYRYAAFGDLEQIIAPLDRTIDFAYDDYGRRVRTTDLARGGDEYTTYNAFDDVVGTLDAAGRTSTTLYDGFGRPESMDNTDGTATWIYDGPGDNEVGRLVEATSASGQITTYGYEARGQNRNRGLPTRTTRDLSATSASFTAQTLITAQHFDEFSRLEQVDYPSVASPVSVKYTFDAYGHTVKAANTSTSSQVYWQLVSADQGYRIKEERLGTHTCGGLQGTTTTRGYYDLTGRAHTIRTTCGSSTLQSVSYDYDAAGNMSGRSGGGTIEFFKHDPLNRLTERAPALAVPFSPQVNYDPNGTGRITWQANVGDYSYDTSHGRDWITSAGSTTYEHDDVGNIIKRTGTGVPGGNQDIDYTSFDLPSKITSPGTELRFGYDSGGARAVKETLPGQGASKATYYAGDLYQRTLEDGEAQQRFMIYAGGRAVAQLTNTVDGAITSATAVRYLHDDVLGSINVVSDATGAATVQRSYSPFGQDASPQSETPFGFTGHESDDDLGLINMRGRIYDPRLAQFLSADPYLQEPEGQGLNRFAYVNNSPLNFVDPSGFIAKPRPPVDSPVAFGGSSGPELNGRAGNPMFVLAGLGAGIGGTAAIANMVGGPTAITGAAAVASSAPPSISAGPPSSVQGAVSFATGIWSILQDAALGKPQQAKSTPAGGAPRGNPQTGGMAQRGGTAPDAIAPVQEGLPRYQGGAPGVSGEGGQHGAGGGGATGRGPFNPGPYVEGGRLSPLARGLLRPIFDRFGYDVAQTQIRFDSSVSTADTNGDVIRINPELWSNPKWNNLNRMKLLTHEITHSVQFQKLGASALRWRLGVERVTHAFGDVYEVPNELANIQLKGMNLTDPRFTLEGIASRMEDFARMVPP